MTDRALFWLGVWTASSFLTVAAFCAACSLFRALGRRHALYELRRHTARAMDHRFDRDRRRRIAEFEQQRLDEIEAVYREMFAHADIELSWALPMADECPTEEQQ